VLKSLLSDPAPSLEQIEAALVNALAVLSDTDVA
jgi:hypothetical protein